MPSRINREAERNIRANDFLQENSDDFTANAFATARIAELVTQVALTGDMRESQISNDGGARQNYEIAEAANEALKLAMRDLADFAATVGEEIEGIEEKFRITRSGGKRGRIARARAFAADAVEYRGILVERGLEANFIDDLNQKADALEQALANAVSDTAERVGAVATKIQALKRSNKIVAMLDPIVRKLYRGNTAKLAAWDFASKIQRDDKPKPPPTT